MKGKDKKEKFVIVGERKKVYYSGEERTFPEALKHKKALISDGFSKVRIKRIKM